MDGVIVSITASSLRFRSVAVEAKWGSCDIVANTIVSFTLAPAFINQHALLESHMARMTILISHYKVAFFRSFVPSAFVFSIFCRLHSKSFLVVTFVSSIK